MHFQTSALEEGVQIPSVAHREADVLAGSGSLRQHAVQRLHVFLGEVFLIVEHEVAVVGSCRIGVEVAVRTGGCLHSAGIRAAVRRDDLVRINHDLLKRLGVHQGVELVVREGEHVRSSLGVVQDALGAVALSLNIHGDVVGLFGMRSLEVLNHTVDPRQVGVIANPHTQGNRLLSGRTAAQRQHHYSSQNHCQQLFHREVPPLFYLTRLSAARMTVLCITQLFAENTECSMTAKTVCYVLIRWIRAFAPSPERRCGAAAVRFPACPSERGFPKPP